MRSRYMKWTQMFKYGIQIEDCYDPLYVFLLLGTIEVK